LRVFRRDPNAFSLIEVVVAVGLLSFALVAILGLLAATTRSAADVTDSEGLASLGAGVQRELERIKTSVGLAGIADQLQADGSAAPMRFVGTRDGRRVLRADGTDPAAGHSLNDPSLPGIANRDRFYLVELTRLAEPDAASDAGFIVVGARCSWPYELPTGPPTPGATQCDADPAREVPAGERSVAHLNFAIRP
jgi:type II secretory pathway pseudopilin PulG